jgi:hypothetical protein
MHEKSNAVTISVVSSLDEAVAERLLLAYDAGSYGQQGNDQKREAYFNGVVGGMSTASNIYPLTKHRSDLASKTMQEIKTDAGWTDQGQCLYFHSIHNCPSFASDNV